MIVTKYFYNQVRNKKREQACVNIWGVANTIAGISYTYIPFFPQFRLFSIYACALLLLQSAILNMDKMVDTLVRLWLQRA